MNDYRTRIAVIAGGMITLLVVITVGLNTLRSIGSPFPGFLIMGNRVVPSISLPHWNTDSGNLFQSQIVAVDGTPVSSSGDVYKRVRLQAAGTAFEYTLRAADGSRSTIIVPSRSFSPYDHLLLYGVYLFNAVVFLATGLIIFRFCPPSAASWGFLSACLGLGAFSLTGADLYGPHWFFRLHVLAETMMAAGVLHLALVFPVDRIGKDRSLMLAAIYLPFAMLAIAYECVLYWPSAYTTVHLIASIGHGVAGVAILASVIEARLRSTDAQTRWRVGIVGAGAVTAFVGPTLLMGGSALFGGGVPVNGAGFTAFIFPLSVAFAISRRASFSMQIFDGRGAAREGAESPRFPVFQGWLEPVIALIERVDVATNRRLPRIVAVAGGSLAVLLIVGLLNNSSAWVGRPFPGFLIMDNRIVASVSLPGWDGEPSAVFQHQISAVDGESVDSTAVIYDKVRSKPAGSRFEYTLRSPSGEVSTANVRSDLFMQADYASLFGTFFLTGAAFLGVGFLVLFLQPRKSSTLGLLSIGVIGGGFVLTATDLYGPSWFFRLHVIAEALVPAALVHLSLVFPANRMTTRAKPVLAMIYLLCLALAVAYQFVLYKPTAYTAVHLMATTAQGIGGLTLVWTVTYELLTTTSEIVRRRIAVAGVGTVVAFVVPTTLMGLSGLGDGAVPVNAAAMTGFVFPIALAYAMLKHDFAKFDRLVQPVAALFLLVAASGYTSVLEKVVSMKSRFL